MLRSMKRVDNGAIIRVSVIANDAKQSYLVAAPPPSQGSVVCLCANGL